MRWQRRPPGANWGDFGPDDQVGRMNLLTPARRLAGVREVADGLAFTLSLPLDYPGGEGVAPMRKPPRLFSGTLEDGLPAFNYPISVDGLPASEVMCDDGVVLYTQYSTQWDSLAHWGQLFDADGDGIAEAVYYNGYRADEHLIGVERPEGPVARALGIENLAIAGVQGRGVLVDLARAFGTLRRKIGYELLMETIARQRVRVEPGDFLLVYTGFDRVLLEMNRSPDVERLHMTGAVLDGRDRRLLDWIVESGIVAICSDNLAIEDYAAMRGEPPIPVPGEHQSLLPLHELCLFKQGIHLGELWYLEALAAWLADAGRSAFLLTAPPLRLPGSVGSPVTPIATV